MYAKIFTSLFDGSMRGHPELILVFVNILCHADQDGIVDRHWQAISDETGLSSESVLKALSVLESPDKDSRSRNDEGKRITRIDPERDWGWQIINFKHYRDMRTAEERREYMRELMRKRRSVSKVLASVSMLADTETNVDVHTKTKKELSGKPDLIATEFEECWKIYPDKSGKENAWKAYQKARKNGTTQQDVLIGLNRYLEYVRHRQATDFKDLKFKNGSTWFNQQCWKDEYTMQSTPVSPATDPLVLDYAKQAYAQIKQGIKVAQFYHSIADKIGSEKLLKVKREVERIRNNE